MALSKRKTVTRSENGRPKKILADVDLEKVERYAAQGLNLNQLAGAMGFHPETFRRLRDEYPIIDEKIALGRGSGIAKVSNALFDKAIAGDTVAMLFYLKAQGGWSDRQQVVIEGGDKPLSIEVSDVRSKVMSALLPPDETEAEAED